ncbi:MAG TPA: nuclear transport factor 2 family protein [Gemmatimonadales bacterium]|jgi:ketosteroid isomerase-like protein|nr:nuclear transport factor 2 family protein [Gemmatimonadales bacterium]
MKQRFALFLLAALCARSLAAQTGAEKAQLLRLEDGWAKALVQRDTAYFRRTLAPGFVYSEDDRTYTRAEVMKDLVSTTDTVTEAHNEEMTVHGFGNTAVVTGWLSVSGRGASGPFQRRYRFTDTWTRLGGRWRMVAAHDYLAPRK